MKKILILILTFFASALFANSPDLYNCDLSVKHYSSEAESSSIRLETNKFLPRYTSIDYAELENLYATAAHAVSKNSDYLLLSISDAESGIEVESDGDSMQRNNPSVTLKTKKYKAVLKCKLKHLDSK